MRNHQRHAMCMESMPPKRRFLKPIAAFLLSTVLVAGVSRDTRLPDTYVVTHPESTSYDDETALIMTANLHKWQSPYGHESTQAALDATLAETKPDIICAQEVTDGEQTRALLNRYNGVFASTKRNFYGKRFGNLILSTAPLELEAVVPLPNSITDEPRNLVIARMLTDKGWLRIGNLHLSINQLESTEQIRYIDQTLEEPLDILCGDFNKVSPQEYYGTFGAGASFMTLPHYLESNRYIPTFPSQLPVFGIDHIFTACPSENNLPYVTSRTRYVASDHYSMLAETAIDRCPSFFKEAGHVL